MRWQDYITIDPACCHGEPFFTGTELLVNRILDSLADGGSPEKILLEHRELTNESLNAAVVFACETANAARQGTRLAESERIHGAYIEYNRTVRAWFVAFGVGVPLLLFTQDLVADDRSGHAGALAVLYLGVVGLQVLPAVLSKWMNWFRYESSLGSSRHPRWRHFSSVCRAHFGPVCFCLDVTTGVLYLFLSLFLAGMVLGWGDLLSTLLRATRLFFLRI